MTDKLGSLIVVSGPSGVGKGTLCKKISESMPGLTLSVSATTRSPRLGEEDGKSYFFIDKDRFKEKIAGGYFLEWAKVFGNYYGTPGEEVRKKISENKDVLLEIDVQGALQVKRNFPEAVLIFIAPPSLSELRRRITDRGTEEPEIIEKRMVMAIEELKLFKKYDYIVTNDEIDVTMENLNIIITAESFRVSRFCGEWE